MKKIVLFCAAIAAAEAKIYVGLKTGFSATQLNSVFSGEDDDGNNFEKFSIKKDGNCNALFGGVFAGYTFMDDQTISPFVEVDFALQGKKKVFSNLKSNIQNGSIDDSSVSVSKKFELGTMVGASYKATETVRPFIGVRLSTNHYKVIATDSSGRPKTKNYQKFLFGVEPTVGVNVAINEKFSIRGSVGYSIQQKFKTGDFQDANEESYFEIKPRSLNVGLGLIYSF
ncbi:MAG: hypothetical protein CNLJKLNK_00202 [Holosporales bacterium]